MKDISKLNVFIFCLLISSIFAKNPHSRLFSRKNKTFDSNKNKHAYNYTYSYGTHFRNRKGGCCPFKFGLGAVLLSLWSALLVLYFLLNRRKNTFTVILPNQVNNVPNNYMNV